MPYNSVLNTEDPAGKIDDKATDGLLGTSDSLAYRVHEIERHLHSAGSWFGAAVTPSGETHVADRIGTTITAFQIDAGNETLGSWTQILGSDDTPARTGMAYYDPHEIVVEDTENASEYFIQFARGDDGSTGYAAGTYTEIVFNATVQKETGIIDVHTGRAPAGSKLWARCLSVGDNTGTFDFYLGIHEYEG
jgi:hypothetical protein